jgi:TrbL/VirB6 plasmid conjugal transfer protein
MKPRLAALAALAVSLALAAPASAAGKASAARPAAASGGAVAGPPAQVPGIQVGPPLPGAPPVPAAPVQVDGGHGDHPGFFDIPGKVKKAIDDWFRGLVKDALNPALKLVGHTLLSTPQVTGQPRVVQFWTYTLGIANGLLVLLIVVAGAIVMGHETVQTRYALKDALPRVLLAAVATNASLAISGQMVSFANALSSGFLAGGVDPAKASERLSQDVVQYVTGGGMFLILLGLVCAVFAVVLLLLYIIRAALILLLVCAAPIMLLGHALPQTEGIAQMWWRAMTAALLVQVAQALILALAVQVFFTPSGHGALGLSAAGGLIDVLVALCLLWLLVKVPFWAREMASRRPSTVVRLVKTYVIGRALRGGVI